MSWRAAAMPFYAVQTALLALDLAPGIAEALRARPDVVAIEHDIAAALSEEIPDALPCVLTAHNVTASYYATRARSSSWPGRLLIGSSHGGLTATSHRASRALRG